MSHEFEALENRIRRLESQNRRLKWLGIVFAALAMTSVAWGQKSGGVVTQAQKFELRDDKGRLRAELSMLNGDPALRFLGEHEDAESVLDGYSFTILKQGGTEADILECSGLMDFRSRMDVTMCLSHLGVMKKSKQVNCK
jgi:hypothetical protein